MARKPKIQHHDSDNNSDMRNNTFPSEPPAEREYNVGPRRSTSSSRGRAATQKAPSAKRHRSSPISKSNSSALSTKRQR